MNIVKPLDKYTVKELKNLLKEKGQRYDLNDTKQVLYDKWKAYMEVSKQNIIEFINHIKARTRITNKPVQTVISRITDFNVQDDYGATPLHWAVRTNNVPVTKFLLSQPGINMEIRAMDGGTPLHWGAYDDTDGSSVELLIDAGANMEAENTEGNTPLVMAVAPKKNIRHMYESNTVPITIRDPPDPKAPPPPPGTLPNIPMRRRGALKWNRAIAEILLQKGAKITGWGYIYNRRKYKLSILYELIGFSRPTDVNDYIEIMDFLLGDKDDNTRNKADIEETENDKTLLMQAVKEDNVPVAKFLLDKGANINAVNKQGYNAYYNAIHYGHVKMCEFLIKYINNHNSLIDKKVITGDKIRRFPYYVDEVNASYIKNVLYEYRYDISVDKIKEQLLEKEIIFVRPPKFSIPTTEEELKNTCKQNYKEETDTYDCPISYEELEPNLTIAIKNNYKGDARPIIWCYSISGISDWFTELSTLKQRTDRDPVYMNPETTEKFTEAEVKELKEIIDKYKPVLDAKKAASSTTGGKRKMKKNKHIKLTLRQIKLLLVLQKKYEKKRSK